MQKHPHSFTNTPQSIPTTLQEFQREFPDDETCAMFLEHLRWPNGFVCSKCGNAGEPYRFTKRKTVILRCRACQSNTSLTVGTVMQQSHTPLTVWFWGAYLVETQNPGMTTVQFQQQLGLSYKTAFQILRKLRSRWAHQGNDPIGATLPVEVDAILVGGFTRKDDRGVQHKASVLVVGAVEVRPWVLGDDDKQRKKATCPGMLRLRIIPNRGTKALTEFVQENVAAGAVVRTDGWHGFDGLAKLGYLHEPMEPDCTDNKTEAHLSIIHLAFSKLKKSLRTTHNEADQTSLQARLNEFVFRFNHVYYPPVEAIHREASRLLLLP